LPQCLLSPTFEATPDHLHQRLDHSTMTRPIHLALFILAFAVSAFSQKGDKGISDKQLQKMYQEFLVDEGYKPEVDEDGDVRFKREGKTYFINVEAEDPECFRLVLANIWPIESEEERGQALVAMDHCNAQAKVAKAYMVKDNVWVAIETFIAKPEDFKAIFKRSLSALDHGVALYAKRMREE
jgi:hypothetical protein